MRLREFFSEDAIKLELESTTKDAVLKELVSLLKLDEKAQAMLFKMLKRRETLGSTGIGQQISIPHCRSLVVTRLRCAFGRSPKDRKSTRLNSSHRCISYAVFCLKKKKKKPTKSLNQSH